MQEPGVGRWMFMVVWLLGTFGTFAFQLARYAEGEPYWWAWPFLVGFSGLYASIWPLYWLAIWPIQHFLF